VEDDDVFLVRGQLVDDPRDLLTSLRDEQLAIEPRSMRSTFTLSWACAAVVF
jgi:hypothetical protein